jgi:hypothetical protein
MKKRTIYFLLLALMATAVSQGCAHKGPILTDFAYQVPQAAVPETGRPAVGVIPFRDNRGKTDSVAGKRFSAIDDEVNDLVVQGTVSEKVTTALKAALKARGLSVKDSDDWDLTETGIPANGAKIIVGGEIKTLWIEALSSFANTKVTARVELRILVADTELKKVIRTLNVSSTIDRQAVAYSRGLVQNTLSEALSAALNQMFNDEDLKKTLL